MEFLGFAITLLAVVLTYLAWYNGRWMKQAQRQTTGLLERNTAILERIAQGQEETRKDMAEARREMAEARKEMAEAIRYLASLVVSEGEKTRRLIESRG